MLPRALAPILFGASVLWPLHALACINSMDYAPKDFSQSYWADLFFWSVGAVFMNRVILRNIWGPAVKGQPVPPQARRAFFVVVGVALLLLLEAVSVGGPLLNFSATDFSECRMSITNLVMLVASPLVLFLLQAAFFHGPGKRRFGDTGKRPIVALVVTSVVLVLGLGMVREYIILPYLCDNTSLGFADIHGYY
ncbi:hypothetical protein COCOR_04574 [Corallococcus coralloides DSM 2259]|uniref:Uncharacterized protein n=1 Tax=Corallococcus coralloides (strain ATCC 25202 / DSM 2259 / NBRC 100086 / M2) TaxID=1144275 RepID=H8MHZ3_CORCM|nr:hypothetical protein [Corallococcus coralloides]AFE05901.1 hypothetical protein COCOR_04574 [Corallococcus coralloides DSM 2259]